MKIRVKIEQEEKEEEPKFSDLNYPKTKEFIDSLQGEITAYNTKSLSDGRMWVVNALNGEVLERKYCKPILSKDKRVMWIPTDHELSTLDQPILYKWNNPNKVTF